MSLLQDTPVTADERKSALKKLCLGRTIDEVELDVFFPYITIIHVDLHFLKIDFNIFVLISVKHAIFTKSNGISQIVQRKEQE